MQVNLLRDSRIEGLLENGNFYGLFVLQEFFLRVALISCGNRNATFLRIMFKLI